LGEAHSEGRTLVTRPFSDTLAAILAGRALEPDEIREAFEAILAGKWTPVQVGAFAIALRMRGDDPKTIVAAAQALRAAMHGVEHGLSLVVDTCGTGGDGKHTLNVSTAAAVVVAACGIPVAKHGNRSVSSKCGSADVLEALGIPIDVPPANQAVVLREANIAFLMAPAHHPALAHASQARRELGVRTIFNALGPLANPARATHQLVGVYDDALRSVVARALGDLGVSRAWVVRSEDGLDEISPAAPTRVSDLGEGSVRERVVSPEDFDVERCSLDALSGGDAAANARALSDLLQGGPHPATNAVILNAAAMLHVAGQGDPRTCGARAREAIASGAAARTLAQWREIARRERA
jgi:anthranilate phosphoribosyltransferase